MTPPRPRPFPSTTALSMLLALVVANFTLQPLTEPDFGWHLRTGLDLIEQGGRLPPLDPYSHTMPDWPWVEHAWLTDLLIASLYQAGGSFGALSVIGYFAMVTAGAWLIAARCSMASLPVRLMACSLSLWVALPFLGARTQMLTLLGLAALMWIVHRMTHGQGRMVWLIPPFFLLWANLHGGFTAGLFYLALVVGLSGTAFLIDQRWPRAGLSAGRPLTVADAGALLFATCLGGLLTFVNPYGWRLHQEILDSLADGLMITTIQEWHPVTLDTLAGRLFVTAVALLAAAMVCWYRRMEPVRWGILAVFFLLAWRHLRNIPLFLIVSLPLVADVLEEARHSIAAKPVVRRMHPSFWSLGGTVVLGLFLTYLGSDHLRNVWQFGVNPAAAFRRTSYPIEAVEWLHLHRARVGTRPVHDYQYGGFLLWWLPETKIFIDGRMPAWRLGDRWIFRDYLDVRVADPPQVEILEKYSIDWALIQRESALARTVSGLPAWRKEYEDHKVVIYSRTDRPDDYSKSAEEDGIRDISWTRRRSE